MAKAKHQKPKPRKPAKQTHSKKREGKQNDVSELREQLDVLGLKIIQVTADGNCFFRALADQLEGDEDQHEKYRGMVVGFIKKNREMFEPFVEDEVPFDDYCQSMGEDGTWAGNMELQAASLVTHSNICIHRNMSPRWYIQNFDKHEALMIHLSYHDGEHYNSVRSKEDTCSGPARPIVIKGDADLSAKSNQPKAAARKSKDECRRNALCEDSIKMVKAGSGCEDARKVEQALQEVDGDVDAAVEVLVAEEGSSDHIVVEAESSLSIGTSNGNASGLRLRQPQGLCLVGHWNTPFKNLANMKMNIKQKTQISIEHSNLNYLAMMWRQIPQKIHNLMKRKSRGTRPAHVVQKRSTSLAVVQLLGDHLPDFRSTKQLTMGRAGRTESKVEKAAQFFRVPFILMEGRLTWVHYASNHMFQAISGTNSAN